MLSASFSVKGMVFSMTAMLKMFFMISGVYNVAARERNWMMFN